MTVINTLARGENLTLLGTARVTEVVDGDTLRLDDGRDVRLVGIQAPKLPLGRKNFPVWPLAPQAKNALETLVLGQAVDIRVGPVEIDRHGRLLAHAYRHDDQMWIQGEMLRLGMARVYSFPDNTNFIQDMLDIEKKARGQKAGLWNLDWYAVRQPDSIRPSDVQSFLIVEGRVLHMAIVKGSAYLNFGDDWRTDFTVMIPKSAMRLFRQAGLDPASLKGRQIQVRGWIEEHNGPLIEATHPESIVIL